MSNQRYPIKCRIRASGDGPARVDVYDDIGPGGWFSDGLTAKDFAAQLAPLSGPLDVHINSAGGDVGDGIAIGTAIRNYRGYKTTFADGIVASIATVIFQAGDKRVAEPGSMLFLHDPFTMEMGNAADFRKLAQDLDKHGDNIAAIYADRAGGTPEQWRQVMTTETWYTADEAVAAGLADCTGSGAAELPADFDLAAYAGIPGRVMAALRSMPRAADGNHAPMTGRHTHAHPAYGSQGGDSLHSHEHEHGADGTPDAHHGHSHDAAPEARYCGQCGQCGTKLTGREDARPRNADGPEDLGDGWVRDPDGTVRFDPDGDGDDDSTPEGDTDHDYFAPDGTPVKPVPPCPVARALTEDRVRAIFREMQAAAKVDDSPWDASKAWHNGAASDDPEAFYRGICAGHHTSGDPSTQTYWALPYRYSPDSPPNAGGVRSAWAVLNGAMGGVQDLADRDAVETKVKSLMKQVNPHWSPDDKSDTSIFAADAVKQYRAALKGARA